MRHRSTIFLLLACLLILGGCSATKQLEAHRVRLLAATVEGVALTEKRDVLGESAVSMMHEAVDRLNPKKGAKYVQAYAKTNGPLLDTLVAQIRQGQSQMPRAQQIAFGVGAATRPYTRDAIDLIPRFEQKYRQIQAVSRITGGLKDVLLGKLANKLGGLFEEKENKQR